MTENHSTPRSLAVDAHTHIFCWGEDPEQGFISRTMQDWWFIKLLVRLAGVKKFPGETLTQKLRAMLQPHGSIVAGKNRRGRQNTRLQEAS